MWEQLARAQAYLNEAYRQASAAFESYRSEQNEAGLQEAARILCAALERLAGDGEFWAALVDLPAEFADHRADIDPLLADVGKVFRNEYDILAAALHDATAASRLTSDTAGAIEAIHRQAASGAALGLEFVSLQHHSETLRAALCGIRLEAHEPARTFWAFRQAKRALRFLGGATVVAANGATMAAPGAILVPGTVALAITSVYFGVDVMTHAAKQDG